MATFNWHITEGIPYALSSSVGGGAGIYQVTVEDFDVAVGNLPFLLYAGDDTPYERVTAQWQKDQFDADRNVGEQSLTGWWLRSQANFSGGAGITYFEPLLGEGSETRFRESRGVNVFTDDGSVTLLNEAAKKIDLGSTSVEVVAGPNRVLVRDGGSLAVWDDESESEGSESSSGGDDISTITTANSLAYTGSLFLIGSGSAIYALDEASGTTATALWTNAPGAVRVFWAKQRIFAAIGPDLYELTLMGGDLGGETPLYTHPDDNWQWVDVTETGGAVWAAGYSGERSAVHVITVDETGSTPALTGATVGIQLPDGEIVNALRGYLNFLLVGTSAGFRVAVTDNDRAGLGPLIFRDEAVLSVAARGDFAWCGLADGLTRKVDLGNEAAGDLAFAWANDLEGSGDVQSLAFFDGRLCLAGASQGLYVESETDLVSSGYLATGFTRFGTLENKHFRNVLVSVDASSGSVAVAAGASDPPLSLVSLTAVNGTRNVRLHIPGSVTQRVSLRFTLSRDSSDPTLGPTLQSYQIRALPAPDRKQRLLQFPLMCFDREKDRWGSPVGGPGFAWVRLKELEALERAGAPVILQDFRTGEARTVVIEQIHFSGPNSPDKGEPNFGGTISLRVRTID